MSSRLPQLREVPISTVERLPELPSQKIKSDHDIETWRTTRSYYDFSLFIRRLCESVVGRTLPYEPQETSELTAQAVSSVLSLLETLDGWIDEIPPQDSPQRFGNLAFRTWGKRLEENASALLAIPAPSPLVPHILPYFLTSFGSFVRMDYGTGHEASFAMFLACLTLTRVFEPEEEEERQLVFLVLMRYLKLCWRLQDVYRLEPAGSHGVWGLDDSCFLPYIFGSAQLRDQTEIPVDAVLGYPLPPTNLYFMAIMRIHEVKHGPFYEHSSQLHAIATGVQAWSKVHTGLLKMFEAEVLGKRVVVQHIPLGGIMEWEPVSSAANPDSSAGNLALAAANTASSAASPASLSKSSASSSKSSASSSAHPGPTAAPWATAAAAIAPPSTSKGNSTAVPASATAQAPTAAPWASRSPASAPWASQSSMTAQGLTAAPWTSQAATTAPRATSRAPQAAECASCAAPTVAPWALPPPARTTGAAATRSAGASSVEDTIAEDG
ncbi:hypothetical protein BD626DRAFT_537814 [Schizophyllum amplum]|uniref:Serine/threonine-protein phosphatase 2A activator n=1 Tax=Schizophyllum amplum TaxID=97359 RepID=A0A550CBL8_9AGAR|nr:hypothetical protein BD626DRAFT_537814 [Auriculariopsis ampla]